MPTTIIEGTSPDRLEEMRKRNMERRFFALAAAVRDHEASLRRGVPSGQDPRDERLYRRLRQICGD